MESKNEKNFRFYEVTFVLKTVSLVGARPQFIKEAVLNEVVRTTGAWEHILVHSGQHYDANMSDVFFEELRMPAPKYNLNIGSGRHGAMTAEVLRKFEEVLIEETPDVVIVYGDTNTTLAGALAAVKLKVPVAHIEAGLRQEPKNMPEEINRMLADRISRHLFCCSTLGVWNLKQEGIVEGVVNVGDIMYDLFLRMRGRFNKDKMEQFALKTNRFVLLTLHRDFNVDRKDVLTSILSTIKKAELDNGYDILFPMHPRTRARIETFGLGSYIENWKLVEPIGYLEMMGLLEESAFVITDSGGLQKEAWYAGKRAAVVMPDTSWRELLDCGWNLLMPTNNKQGNNILSDIVSAMPCPSGIYGAGNAAQTIIETIKMAY